MLDLPKHFAERVVRFEQECARLAREGGGQDAVVFLGDSLVEYYKGPLAWTNRGICSDHLQWPDVNVFQRLGPNRLHPNPRAIVTLVGINDLNDAPDALDQHLSLYQTLVSTLAHSYPQASLGVCSLLPTRGSYSHLNPAIQQFNRRLSELASSSGAAFLNLHERFLDPRTGTARAGWLVADGIHLSRRGYAELTTVVETHAADLGVARVPRQMLAGGLIRAWRKLWAGGTSRPA